MNLVMIVLLLALIVSGIGLVTVSGGPEFVWYHRIHKWATYLLTPVLIGHIVIAAGLLPGYRGTWRAMHLGGRLRTRVAERLWPAWLERERTKSAHSPETDHELAVPDSASAPPVALDRDAPKGESQQTARDDRGPVVG
jgi:formate dehydrogenase subunit gamma